MRDLYKIGNTLADVAAALKISVPTLTKYYADELSEGLAIMVDDIRNRLFEKAKEGDVGACIFILKAKGGWSERSQLDVNANVQGGVVFVELPKNGREASG